MLHRAWRLSLAAGCSPPSAAEAMCVPAMHAPAHQLTEAQVQHVLWAEVTERTAAVLELRLQCVHSWPAVARTRVTQHGRMRRVHVRRNDGVFLPATPGASCTVRVSGSVCMAADAITYVHACARTEESCLSAASMTCHCSWGRHAMLRATLLNDSAGGLECAELRLVSDGSDTCWTARDRAGMGVMASAVPMATSTRLAPGAAVSTLLVRGRPADARAWGEAQAWLHCEACPEGDDQPPAPSTATATVGAPGLPQVRAQLWHLYND